MKAWRKPAAEKIQCVQGEIGHHLTRSLNSSHSQLPLTVCVCVRVINSQFTCFTFHISLTHTHTHTHTQQIGLKRISLLSLCYFGPVSVFFARSRKQKLLFLMSLYPKRSHTLMLYIYICQQFIYTRTLCICGYEQQLEWIVSVLLCLLIAGVKCNRLRSKLETLAGSSGVCRPTLAQPSVPSILPLGNSELGESQPKTSKEARPDFARTPVASD